LFSKYTFLNFYTKVFINSNDNNSSDCHNHHHNTFNQHKSQHNHFVFNFYNIQNHICDDTGQYYNSFCSNYIYPNDADSRNVFIRNRCYSNHLTIIDTQVYFAPYIRHHHVSNNSNDVHFLFFFNYSFISFNTKVNIHIICSFFYSRRTTCHSFDVNSINFQLY